MKNPVFTGAGVAIITPMYEDGSINFDELGRIIEDQIAHHTDAIIICGTTGECSTMTDEEQLAAMREHIREEWPKNDFTSETFSGFSAGRRG